MRWHRSRGGRRPCGPGYQLPAAWAGLAWLGSLWVSAGFSEDLAWIWVSWFRLDFGWIWLGSLHFPLLLLGFVPILVSHGLS